MHVRRVWQDTVAATARTVSVALLSLFHCLIWLIAAPNPCVIGNGGCGALNCVLDSPGVSHCQAASASSSLTGSTGFLAGIVAGGGILVLCLIVVVVVLRRRRRQVEDDEHSSVRVEPGKPELQFMNRQSVAKRVMTNPLVEASDTDGPVPSKRGVENPIYDGTAIEHAEEGFYDELPTVNEGANILYSDLNSAMNASSSSDADGPTAFDQTDHSHELPLYKASSDLIDSPQQEYSVVKHEDTLGDGLDMSHQDTLYDEPATTVDVGGEYLQVTEGLDEESTAQVVSEFGFSDQQNVYGDADEVRRDYDTVVNYDNNAQEAELPISNEHAHGNDEFEIVAGVMSGLASHQNEDLDYHQNSDNLYDDNTDAYKPNEDDHDHQNSDNLYGDRSGAYDANEEADNDQDE